MSRREPGFYELLIDEALAKELAEPDSSSHVVRRPLRDAEAGDRIAVHLARIVERAVSALPEKQRAGQGLVLARALVATLAAHVDQSAYLDDSPVLDASVLEAIWGYGVGSEPEVMRAPMTPLVDTTLFTNARGEPAIGYELSSEIDSASRIDLIMAFIRRSGLRPFEEALRRHCRRGRPLRVLTTTYTGSTEAKALEMLLDLGAEVRVSYDISSTRLHAKAWLFHRPAGLTTAYVGSSNLTHSAQRTGLEWNVRVSGARNRDVVDKVAAVFDTYWEGGDFTPFDAKEFRERIATSHDSSRIFLSPVEIRLEPFQERLLEKIDVARERGRHRNLLVSATGTGKTVMAAVDYARLRSRLPRGRLLFVAHRQELLEQALATYRHALRDHEFGELWVGGKKPVAFEHVFASIQSLDAARPWNFAPDYFDVVVVDEFHHAAAKSYSALLGHVAPGELLGLTATPERSDGLPILGWFHDCISAELRLWDAIDQNRLVPFDYYGMADGTDLSRVPWKKGRGYDVEGLSKVYTGNDAWARGVLQQVDKHVDDPARMRALGFCVSVDHARFMARVFREHGLAAVAVWGDSPKSERMEALRQLAAGEIQCLFSVDLFNEGVDLPDVDTLLLLRPTDSAVLFLQQLGRGLRKAPTKTSCLVLDFVGQHHHEFRFDRRLRGLLGGTRKDIERQVEQGFPFLPAGCHMELQPRAREIVLASIRNAIPGNWTAKAAELRSSLEQGRDSLAEFLEDSGLELDDIYSGNKSWSDLREAAGAPVAEAGPAEAQLRRGCGRMLHVDDAYRLQAYRELLLRDEPPQFADITEPGARFARMLVASVCDKAAAKTDTLAEGLALLWRHPQVRAELVELFGLLAGRVDHRHHALAKHPEVPLRVHARYSRLEILAAFDPQDRAKVAPWQTGVLWLEEARCDLFAFTLDKTSGQFSPTTRYRDYAISPSRIHWESQSVTREDSDTGRRYQGHVAQGSDIMLFARECQNDRAFWFLGPATYVRHQGERPMAITWDLDFPLSGDQYQTFAAAVA